ncbi:MAG TPA: Calx-beta domain-containing protein [Thermoanaerobaculia bacterium]|nr:Calx-beta domain-containing protein [Thermoanaerobaculia bacterium]
MKPAVPLCALLLLTAGALAAQYDPPGGDPDPGGGGDCSGENIVQVRDDLTFDPKTITIQAGETVTWCKEASGMPHNVVEDGGAFRCANGCDHVPGGNGDPASGDWSFSLQFNDPETVRYYCEVHGGPGGFAMSGRVVVEAGGGGGDGGGGGGGGGGDGAPGALRFESGAYTVAEAAGSVALRIRRVGGDDGAVGVQLATANGTATAGQDYTAVNQNVSWAAGDDGTKTVAVPILNDTAVEGDETFTATLSNPTGGATLGVPATATVTIQDDDAVQGPGQIGFGAFAFAADRNAAAVVEVVRTAGSAGQVSVQYATQAGTATPQDDYEPRSGTLTFAAGETSKTVTVPLKNDGEAEGLKAFGITLSSPGGGAILGAIRRATILVFDDKEVQQALTPDEVLCDELRLASFLDRLAVGAPNSAKASGVNVAFTRLGDFAGVAYTGNGPGTPEHQLAFSTNPEETTLLRNPGRPQLGALSMSRNQTSSDLVPAGSPDELRISLNPTLGDHPAPESLLTIDDLGDPVTREGGKPSESKPGRGLADAVRVCHGKLTALDQHVFRVLAKIARATADGAAAFEIAIFRGAAPDAYRLDVYPLDAAGAPRGRLAVELEVDFGPGGRLDGGTLRVLERCGAAKSDNCTSVTGFTELQLVEPAASGEFWNDGPFAVSTSGVQGDGQPTVDVDFAALLAGTSWRSPG